ncbi:hypothetical protein D2917_27225 [Cupriavidus oxalaticus]|nr:hypothetical protein D2917_27225 [Cupriavidus oxalaticus]
MRAARVVIGCRASVQKLRVRGSGWRAATRARTRAARLRASVRAMHRDAIGNVFVTTRERTSLSNACRQVFLHFFLNIIVQTNYDSP